MVESGTPEKVLVGYYVYEWLIPLTIATGEYTVSWDYVLDGVSTIVEQEVIVAADGQISLIYSGITIDMIRVLEYYISCAQNIPVYFEQARPTKDYRTYKFSFPQWNQTRGLQIYRNNQPILSGL